MGAELEMVFSWCTADDNNHHYICYQIYFLCIYVKKFNCPIKLRITCSAFTRVRFMIAFFLKTHNQLISLISYYHLYYYSYELNKGLIVWKCMYLSFFELYIPSLTSDYLIMLHSDRTI